MRWWMAWIKTCITSTEYGTKWSVDEWMDHNVHRLDCSGCINGIGCIDGIVGRGSQNGTFCWCKLFDSVHVWYVWYIYIFPLLFQPMYTNIILLGHRSLRTHHQCQNDGLASLPAILDIYRIAMLEKFGLEWMYWWHWMKGYRCRTLGNGLVRD